MSPTLMVVAGEVSGDLHAGRVLAAVRRRRPDVRAFGIGGEELRAAGMEILQDAREMAVLGLWEVLKRYGFFRRVFAATVRAMEARRPDALLLVDYPGFNLPLAREAKRRGVRVLYFICPQVWAWRRGRIRDLARDVDRLLVIFPFEKDVFRDTALTVDYVGHPLVDEARAALAEPPAPLPGGDLPRVALLPGSRRQEIERILPVMWRAARRLEQRLPAAFLLAAASEESARQVEALLPALGPGPTRVHVLVGQTRQILRQSACAMIASGTATVEAALLGCPMAVLYRTSALTYAAGRRLVRVPHLGMVNLIAGRALCPEFIQDDAQPDAVAAALAPLVEDTPERAAMVAGLRAVARALGEGGAAERAAQIVAGELDRPSAQSAGA